MHKVSSQYKRAMEQPLRERGYIQISLGAISLEAQGSANAENNDYTYWSDTSGLFVTADYSLDEYATMEHNFIKADGKLLFMPEENAPEVLLPLGVATKYIYGGIKITFSDEYKIKGLTLDFGSAYPTEFTVTTSNGTVHTFTNNAQKFVTTTVIGKTSYIIIKPISMVGGQQRFRLKNALMGVGLNFTNNDVESSTYEEFVSEIAEEVPYVTFTANILDPQNQYNVDSSGSFINFFQIGQEVRIINGMTLEDGTIEWVELANLYLQEWSSTKGHMTFKAVDIYTNLDDEYTLGNKIYTRSALTEAQSILSDMGVSPDDYYLDNYLSSVTLTNPMPEGTHKECLQLLSNLTRCALSYDYNGKVTMKANFALNIEPDDIEVNDFGTGTAYSVVDNILVGKPYVYADFTSNFTSTDGSMIFLPEDSTEYIGTTYVSKDVANGKGVFNIMPKISMTMEAGYTFFGCKVEFNGNPPQEMKITTKLYDEVVEEETFTDLEKISYIYYEFDRFNEIIFSFPKGAPNDRVCINKISFGDFNDYKLSMDNMTASPYGTREGKVKSISVKIYSFEEETDSEGNVKVKEVDDDVWYTKTLDTVGDNIQVENPLVSSESMAKTLADWLGTYYSNNVNYEVAYRGDARLNATDIIHMDSEAVNNLQVVINKHTLNFNGAWSGNLSLRKALRQQED